ncbi:MAG: hypothetical protein ABSC17_04150 [Thermacetogeniaceae bacterium]
MDRRQPEFLEGFEKRMQIVAAIDSIVNRGNRNMDLERLLEPGQLDNIIFSVLVFIMERTLAVTGNYGPWSSPCCRRRKRSRPRSRSLFSFSISTP